MFRWQTILFNDPFGDKVITRKSKNTIRKDYRHMLKTIRLLRRYSKSFRDMYSDLNRPDKVFIYEASTRIEGVYETVPYWHTDDGSTIMNIETKDKYSDINRP